MIRRKILIGRPPGKRPYYYEETAAVCDTCGQSQRASATLLAVGSYPVGWHTRLEGNLLLVDCPDCVGAKGATP